MDNRSDEEDIRLLYSFLNGDDGAFSFIYNKFVDELFSYGLGLGFEREVLKDAIQDIFVKFYMNKTQLKGVVHLKYYMFRMLKNRLLDIYKSVVKENPLEMSEFPFLIEPSVLDELIAGEDKANLELRVGELLRILTDRQKEAIYLHFIREMEYEEVANLLDMTAPAVRKLISRAIKRMRDENI
ncbi:MAG: sigma-70 family RNA polymerase sigma factor [Tannerella sp.]|jgi:RNA polymerase sigma factor (sigma-70 family)|nr:sigma-70 family RNA polymerase sigma factor [Tannerella sp.]